MAYTIKEVSELSGVTPRALRFYEAEGLLRPSYYSANRYRYYEEKELLRLQQILFFKELGFSLKQIRKVLGKSDFDQLAALYSHRSSLSKEWEKIGRLIETIDKTIQHIKREKTMKDREFFDGFTIVTKGKGQEPYFAAEAVLLNTEKRPGAEKREKSYYENIDKRAKDLLKKIVGCMEKGLKPVSKEVQGLIKIHHAFVEEFLKAPKEVYEALAQMYRLHPAFRQQLDPIHPKLAEFMSKAMETFAEREL